MQYIQKANVKGFTLVEVLVSLFMFVILMAAVTQIFSRSFSGYRAARALQRDTENAQYALNSMAKALRTSSIVRTSAGDPESSGLVTTDYVKFFDYSQNLCFEYMFRPNAATGLHDLLLMRDASSDQTYATCAGYTFSNGDVVTTGDVTGKFIVQPSTKTTSPAHVGQVTVSLVISEGAIQTAFLETTVSLRDYAYVGGF